MSQSPIKLAYWSFLLFEVKVCAKVKAIQKSTHQNRKSIYMQAVKHLCIGFTSYRPEILNFAASYMQKYGTILLEEPQCPGFEEMLKRELRIRHYLLETDFEFPEYAYRSCTIMRELYEQGKTILQVDPYMDELVRIHEFFVSGGTPEQISRYTPTGQVYSMEKQWTKRLLDFYKASASREFERIVYTVKEFARMDAQRGLLRNQMRAQRIAELLDHYNSIYLEAGYIHLALMPMLLRQLPPNTEFTPVYLQEPVMRSLAGRRQILAPGDILTFIYTFQSDFDQDRTALLAAQSLVYNKIVQKEEMCGDERDVYPHSRDELEAINLSSALNFEQCKRLFYEIRSMPTAWAKALAVNFIDQLGFR